MTKETITLDIPIRTISEANDHSHWRIKDKRKKAQQKLISIVLNPHKSKLKLPCKITLTRFAPKKLDKHDNLPMSFKYILDRICAIITNDFRPGRADDTDEIEVSYHQVIQQDYAIKIIIEMQ